MKKTSSILSIILIELITTINTFAVPLSFEDAPSFSTENLQKAMGWFTAQPHPMGSKTQSKIAMGLKQTLKQFGLETKELKFNAQIPNYKSNNQDGSEKKINNTLSVIARNIISLRKGTADCVVFIGGHYDTKYFKEFKFVGANDGGSSTVLMMELARVLKKTKFNTGSLGSCHIGLLFFDGEESLLKK